MALVSQLRETKGRIPTVEGEMGVTQRLAPGSWPHRASDGDMLRGRLAS